MKQRIQKVLASAGIASRRNIEEMVQQGRITVNGQVVTELPVMVDPEKDRVKVDDEPIRLTSPKVGKRYYFLLHKPKGVVCTNVSQGEQLRAVDLLPPTLDARLFPVGRLDVESKGLLLLTNDGDLTNQLTHPRYGVPKTYQAVVDGRVDGREMEQMYKGIWMADKFGRSFKTGPVKIRAISRTHMKSVLEITLREGRNREVRRMLAAIGHKVRDLTRIRMGPLTLEHLPLGHCRQLSEREIKSLRRAITEAQEQSLRVKEGPADVAGEDVDEMNAEDVADAQAASPAKGAGLAAAKKDLADRPRTLSKRITRPKGKGGLGSRRPNASKNRPRQDRPEGGFASRQDRPQGAYAPRQDRSTGTAGPRQDRPKGKSFSKQDRPKGKGFVRQDRAQGPNAARQDRPQSSSGPRPQGKSFGRPNAPRPSGAPSKPRPNPLGKFPREDED